MVYVGIAPAFLMSKPGTGGYDRMLLEEIEDEAWELLRKLSWLVKVAGGDVAGTHLGMGEVDLEIVACTQKLGADLIVVGGRGHRGLRRAIGGSVSDAVIRHAPCPVLVVRSHEGVEGSATCKRADRRPEGNQPPPSVRCSGEIRSGQATGSKAR